MLNPLKRSTDAHSTKRESETSAHRNVILTSTVEVQSSEVAHAALHVLLLLSCFHSKIKRQWRKITRTNPSDQERKETGADHNRGNVAALLCQ